MDVLGSIIAYEAGELPEQDTLNLFAHLIRSGMAWQLQGSYGRTAQALIDQGLISPGGELAK